MKDKIYDFADGFFLGLLRLAAVLVFLATLGIVRKRFTMRDSWGVPLEAGVI